MARFVHIYSFWSGSGVDDDGWLVEMFSEQRLSFCSEDIFFLGLRSFFAACLVFSCFRAHLLVGLCVCVCVVFLCIVLRFEIFDGCTNRIFSQHTAVKFDRWQF